MWHLGAQVFILMEQLYISNFNFFIIYRYLKILNKINVKGTVVGVCNVKEHVMGFEPKQKV